MEAAVSEVLEPKAQCPGEARGTEESPEMCVITSGATSILRLKERDPEHYLV
jgi:hypothetical protein